MQVHPNVLFAGIRISFLVVVAIIFLGGLSDWVYINTQEYTISLATTFVEYLTSYVSAFLIAGIELTAVYYFEKKYDLGKTRRLFNFALIAGALGFVAYMVGETLAGLGVLGNSLASTGNTNPSVLQVIAWEISPNDLDYGNALVIFLSIFALVLLVGVLFRINPVRNPSGQIPNGSGFLGGAWTSLITTFSAMVCCGPLPGAIALSTGISSIYFTDVINLQSLIVLVSVPLLVYAILLADRRARGVCKLR
jgi:hypothetical protein